MRELEAQIDIDASAAKVWEILTDFAAYPDWNPFLRSMSGEPSIGGKMKIAFQPPGGHAITMRPRLLEFEPERKIRWLGHLLVPGLFDGEHTLMIDELDAGHTRFTQHEKFSGLLVPFTSKILAATQRGFQAMNRALKQRAESGA